MGEHISRPEEISALVKTLRSYPEGFAWDLPDVVEKVYRLPEGLFVMGRHESADSLQRQLLWGAASLTSLVDGVQAAASDFPSFIFRCGGSPEVLQERRHQLAAVGLEATALHLRYDIQFADLAPPTERATAKEPQPGRPIALNRDHLESVHELDREIFTTLNLSREEALHWLTVDNHVAFGARVEGSLIGFILGQIYGENPPAFFIRNLGVKREHRRQGWGETLARSVLLWAQENGATHGMLWVEAGNVAARRLYEKLGYRLNGSEAELLFQHEQDPGVPGA